MTADKLKDILTNLGYKLSDFGNHWRTSALYRGGTNPTALQIYKDSGVWVDFVKNSSYLPFESLIEATLKTNDPNVISKITEGYDFDTPQESRISKPKISIEKVYPNSVVENLLPHYSFYNNRGISEGTLRNLSSGMSTEGSMYQRFVFPVYNGNSQIVGLSGRDLSPNHNGNRPKWKHEGKKSSWIYPFYSPLVSSLVSQSIHSSKQVIIVESIGDLLFLHECGVFNVLVCFGTSISSALICFLVSAGCSEIIISLNNDAEKDVNRGQVGAFKSYLKLLNYFSASSLIIHPPTKNDFGDMSEDDFEPWYNYLVKKDYNEAQGLYHEKILSLIKSKDISQSLYKKKFFT